MVAMRITPILWAGTRAQPSRLFLLFLLRKCEVVGIITELDPADYIIWVRTSDKDSSYMFLTHADLKLVLTLHPHNNGFPEILDAPSRQVQAIYKNALLVLGKDVDHASSSH
jgi:hypothetical protein